MFSLVEWSCGHWQDRVGAMGLLVEGLEYIKLTWLEI
jgi:hypothetical protein